jgi:hypothetical protein
MDLRRVVGGLLTRDAVLSALLLNYADRLEGGRSVVADPRFIVPSWADRAPDGPHETRVLTVTAHTCRDDPRPHDHLDAVLALLHGVLTGEEARRSITARSAGAPADLQVGVDTVAKLGSWEITLAPSQAPAPPQPWPHATTDPHAGRRSGFARTGGRRQPIDAPGAEGLPPAPRAGSSSR